MDGVRRAGGRLRAAFEGQARSGDKASRSASRLSRALARVKGAASGLGGRLGLGGLVATLGGAASVAGIKRFVDGYATAGDELAKFSRRAGIAAQTYAELRHVAALAGVEQEQFDKAMVKMTRNLGELRAGQGSLHTFLNKASRPFAKMLKGVKSNEQALLLLLEGMGKLEDPSSRAALAAAAFGRAGQMMTLMLEGGTDGLAEQRAEFRRLHGVIDGQALKDAEAYVDANQRLKISIGGAAQEIGRRLIPVLSPLMDRLTEWLAANRELVGQKVAEWVVAAGRGVKALGGFLADVWRVTSDVVDAIGGPAGLAAVLGALVGAKVLVGLATMVTSFKALKAGVSAMTGLLGSLVATLVFAITQWRTLTGEANTFAAASPEERRRLTRDESFRQQTEGLAASGDRGAQAMLMAAFPNRFKAEDFETINARTANAERNIGRRALGLPELDAVARDVATAVRDFVSAARYATGNATVAVGAPRQAIDAATGRPLDPTFSTQDAIARARSPILGTLLPPEAYKIEVEVTAAEGSVAKVKAPPRAGAKVVTKNRGASSMSRGDR